MDFILDCTNNMLLWCPQGTSIYRSNIAIDAIEYKTDAIVVTVLKTITNVDTING